MPFLKKSIFALPFLLFFFLFCLNLDSFLQNANFLFSFDPAEIIRLVLLVFYLILSSAFFAILISLSGDWKIVLPSGVLASLTPFFFISSSAYLLILGFFLSFLMTWFFLQKKLKNYLTFQASPLLMPSVKSLTTLIILVSSLVFYLNLSQSLEKNGFQLPDSLLDPIINMTTSGLPSTDLPQGPGPMFNLPLNPNDLIKGAVNSQIQSLIEPNLGFVAVVLAITFFVSLNFLASFLALLISPIISGIFLILEKTDFTKFEAEKREVKKLVI